MILAHFSHFSECSSEGTEQREFEFVLYSWGAVISIGRLTKAKERVKVKNKQNRRYKNGKCKRKTIGRQSFG